MLMLLDYQGVAAKASFPRTHVLRKEPEPASHF